MSVKNIFLVFAASLFLWLSAAASDGVDINIEYDNVGDVVSSFFEKSEPVKNPSKTSDVDVYGEYDPVWKVVDNFFAKPEKDEKHSANAAKKDCCGTCSLSLNADGPNWFSKIEEAECENVCGAYCVNH